MKSELIRRVLRTVDKFSSIHTDKVVPLLQKHEEELERNTEDIQALFELVEMYFIVIMKGLSSGVFENPTEDPDKLVEILGKMDQIQDEYLACHSVAIFLAGMGKEEEEDLEEDFEEDVETVEEEKITHQV